jgi:hypothetical protein
LPQNESGLLASRGRNLLRRGKTSPINDRASEAADGAFVNAIVYQDQYNTARARLRELRKVGEVKKCSQSDLNPPPE